MTNDEFLSKYVFKELTEDVLAECEHFSCGVGDLDEYFQKDVLAYSRRMVSRSYVFCPKGCPQKIACAFSVSYDSIDSYQQRNNDYPPKEGKYIK